MNISWGNSWAKSWGSAWGPITSDVARSGWFRLWLIGLQEASDKKPEEVAPEPKPVFTKVVEQEDGTALVGSVQKKPRALPRQKRTRLKSSLKRVLEPSSQPIELPKFEPAGVTYFEEIREFVTNLNFPRINISFAALENKVKLHEKKRRENDDIHALLLLV